MSRAEQAGAHHEDTSLKREATVLGGGHTWARPRPSHATRGSCRDVTPSPGLDGSPRSRCGTLQPQSPRLHARASWPFAQVRGAFPYTLTRPLERTRYLIAEKSVACMKTDSTPATSRPSRLKSSNAVCHSASPLKASQLVPAVSRLSCLSM